MKKMQRNKPVRIAAILLVLMFITTCALTGTLARYTSTATVASQFARVAAWKVQISFNYNGTNEATADWYNFDDPLVEPQLKLLGGPLTHNMVTALEHNDAAPNTVWTNAETSNIAQAKYNLDANTTAPDFLFAPGTGGYINFAIRNQSEVPVSLAIDFSGADTTTLPNVIKVGYKSTGAITAADMAVSTIFTGSLSGGLPVVSGGAIPTNTIRTVGIAWKWDYGVTTDGTAEVPEVPEVPATCACGADGGVSHAACPCDNEAQCIADGCACHTAAVPAVPAVPAVYGTAFSTAVDDVDTGFGKLAAAGPALYAALEGAKIVAVQLD